jgi:hypothetical protein
MTTILKKIVKAYKENQATIICGALVMNGSANVYQTYVDLSK